VIENKNELHVNHSKQQMNFHNKLKPILIELEHQVHQNLDDQKIQYPKKYAQIVVFN